jgi:predicted Zn-dependent peptidase
MKNQLIIKLVLNSTYARTNHPSAKTWSSPTVKIGKPVTFELKNGLKVMVVENHKLPVSFSLTLDNDPYQKATKGVADMTST